MTDWSRSRPLIWVRRPSRIPANTSRVKDSCNGSGPSEAMPGTSCGERTTYAASRFWVPASVRSNPAPSENRTRSAIGDLPGRSIVAGDCSDQRSQPALAR